MIKEGRTVPRKGHTQKRDVLADPIYNNKVVTKLVNNIMLDGDVYKRQGLILDLSPRTLEKVLYFASYIVLDAGNTALQYKQVLSEGEYQDACLLYTSSSC